MAIDSTTRGFLQPITGLPSEDIVLDEILQALVVGITGMAGTLVRPRWQPRAPAMPEPQVDWAAIGITDETSEPNISQVHIPDGDGSTISYDNDIITVLVSFYGPTARGNSKHMRTGIMIPQNRETLFNTGLALMEIPGNTVFVPEIFNNQTIRRADMSMRFRRRTTLVWPVLNLLEFSGTLSTDLEGGSLSIPMKTPSSRIPLVR